VASLRKLFGFHSLRSWVPAPVLLREMAWRYWMRGEAEIKLLKDLIKPGTNSIDVGVASGLYSYHMSRFSRHVYAFEPNLEWTSWLSRAVPRNVSVFEVALSDRMGNAVLSIPPPSLESLRGDLNLRCAEAASIEKSFEGIPCDRVRVPVAPLDSYGLEDVGFIKIDVEGHELAVLRGAERTLARSRPAILVEIEGDHIKRDPREEFAEIQAMGYEGSFYLSGRFRPIGEFDPGVNQPPLPFGKRPATYVNNFIFKPTEQYSR
jgi:FkbM family methyltransferase